MAVAEVGDDDDEDEGGDEDFMTCVCSGRSLEGISSVSSCSSRTERRFLSLRDDVRTKQNKQSRVFQSNV